MKSRYKILVATACVVATLSACGKKESVTPPPVIQPGNNGGDSHVLNNKKTKDGGIVSSIDLEPVFAVPGKYSGYVRQEATEATKPEIQNLSDTALDSYVKTWIKQAASVANPNWVTLASILHPEVSEATNEFKKQEAAEKAKTEIAADKSSLNVIVGFQGEIFNMSAPDITSGEYYLRINTDSRYSTLSYSPKGNYNYQLFYQPVLKDVGMAIEHLGCSSCKGDVNITVKVPVEKAKEIESLREKGKDMIRVYGHVTGIKDQSTFVNKGSASSRLNVEVEAIEVGSRQDGQFKSYFFLDTDQLKKWKE